MLLLKNCWTLEQFWINLEQDNVPQFDTLEEWWVQDHHELLLLLLLLKG